MKLLQTALIHNTSYSHVFICKYDNGDYEGESSQFYQMHIEHQSDDGVSFSTTISLNGFSPRKIIETLRKL